MHHARSRSPLSHKKALLAGAVGNFIEWYEFAVYGFLATVIAENVFRLQGESALTGLILTYASFAVAFFFRPLGVALFGRLGDRLGRKPTLIMVLVLMTIATAAIGLVPTYASIGITAPVLMTLLRILQGFFAGGEYGGAVALMTEFAPRGKRGLYGAWQSLTVALGLLAGAGVVALLAAVLGQEALLQWGWRIAFFLALPMGAVALWLRLSLKETPAFIRSRQAAAGRDELHHRPRYRPANGVVRGGVYLFGDHAYLPAIGAAHPYANRLAYRRHFQRRFCPDHYPRRHVERQDRPATRAHERHRAAVGVILSAPATIAKSGGRFANQRAGSLYRRRRGRPAGGPRPGDVGGNVSHPGTLYRAGAALPVVKCGLFRLRGFDDYLAD